MEYKYGKPDKMFYINEDSDLKPFPIDINKTIQAVYKFWNPNSKDCPILKPPPEKIRNYGLAPKDQYFYRPEIPARLKHLAKQMDGVPDKIWPILASHKENYYEEIEFIRQEWYHTIYGCWYYINGKPYWISPWHYQYLIYATGSYREIDRKTGKRVASLHPEFRFVDWKKFIAYHYFYTTTETFAKIDEHGDPIPEEDGTYKMKDLKRRTFFGIVRPKHRRAGETLGWLSMLYFQSLIIAGPEAYSSICANQEGTTRGHWNKKFIPLWRRAPFFFKPITDVSTRPKTELTWKAPGGKENSKKFGTGSSTEALELDATIDFSPIVSRSYYDNAKITGTILMDEEGKTTQINIWEEWQNLVKPTMSQGAESEINERALCGHPSTVEDLETGGGIYYKQMCDASDPWKRHPESGQTESGLALVYFSSTEGLENFVGPYGESIIDDPTPEQIAYTGWEIGAKKFIDSTIEMYEKNPTIDNVKSLIKFKRRNPPSYADIWRSMAGEIGFNIKKIDQRLDANRRRASLNQDPRERGDFVWIVEGYPPLTAEQFWGYRLQDYHLPHAWVDWRPSPEGRFLLSKKLEQGSHNRVQYNQSEEVWEVMDNIFYASADPVAYQTKNQAKMRDDKSSASFAAGAVLYPRQEDEEGKQVAEWQSHKFVCTYKNKPQLDDIYAEEMLMMCRYFGCQMFPETNITLIVKHFELRGYAGLLQYAWIPDKNKYRDTPGFHTGGQQSKDELISEVRDYIEYYSLNEDHTEILEEWRRMKAKEDMTKLDLFTATAGCLLAYKQRPMVLSAKKLTTSLDDDDDEGMTYEDIYGRRR